MIGKFPKVGPRVYGAPLNPFAGVYTWWANINNATFSNSGGTNYVDTIPLTGISDSFVQPTAAERPIYLATGLNGNATMQVVSGSPRRIYKATDASIFQGGGTFAFVHYLTGGLTYFTEATANASLYNFQVLIAVGNIRFYTDANGGQNLVSSASLVNTWTVHHFTISGTTLKYYQNGVLVATKTVTQNMNTARPLTAFNYKTINAEQGFGQFGDIAALTGTALNDTQVANDYTNFWKVKYPSLP